MQIELSFDVKNVEQLYITYKNNPLNYKKIKEIVIGTNAEEAYRKSKKGVLFFFTAVTFIIAVSSSFSAVSGHWDSFISLWLIWGLALVLLFITLSIMYNTTMKVYKNNKTFFDNFELVAQKAPTLEDFATGWKAI